MSYNELIQEVVITENVKEETEDNSNIEIDWEKLKSINKDIIAWIKIDGTHINYPILKSTDKLEYMTRSYDLKYNSNGSVFTLNSNPFFDNVTTIYGHNMKSGLMFTDLSKYMDKNFFKEHQTFEIYTESKNYIATVFSVYSTGEKTEENNVKNLSFAEEINYYKLKNVNKIENIDNINKIVKLSTCSYLNNKAHPTNQRYYIVAKLYEKQ